jgi:hypothetical protein
MPKTPVSVDTTAWSVVTPRFPRSDAPPALLTVTCPVPWCDVPWLAEGAPFCLSLAEAAPACLSLAGVTRQASPAALSLVGVLDSPLTPHHLKGLVVP